MARALHLTIASPAEVFFDGEATEVSLPSVEGVIQILAGHEPLITTLRVGTISYTAHGVEQSLNASGGVVEVAENRCTVLL